MCKAPFGATGWSHPARRSNFIAHMVKKFPIILDGAASVIRRDGKKFTSSWNQVLTDLRHQPHVAHVSGSLWRQQQVVVPPPRCGFCDSLRGPADLHFAKAEPAVDPTPGRSSSQEQTETALAQQHAGRVGNQVELM